MDFKKAGASWMTNPAMDPKEDHQREWGILSAGNISISDPYCNHGSLSAPNRRGSEVLLGPGND